MAEPRTIFTRMIPEKRKSWLDSMTALANLPEHPADTDKYVFTFVQSVFDYGRIRRKIETYELILWEDEERKRFLGKFPNSLENLTQYLSPAIQKLNRDDPVSNKIYRSALVFLREDIFNIYEEFRLPEEPIAEVRNYLNRLREHEQRLPIPRNNDSKLPDLKGVPFAHYWWRDAILTDSPKEIHNRVKQFLYLLSEVSNLSGDPRYYTNECVSDFMWALCDYMDICKTMKMDKLELLGDDRHKLFNLFPRFLEQLKKYLLFSILNLDGKHPNNAKIYKSALKFLREDILIVYKTCEPPENLINKVGNELEILKVHEYDIYGLTNINEQLPDINELSISHSQARINSNRRKENEVKKVIKRIVNSEKFRNLENQINTMAEKHETWADKAYFVIYILQIKDLTMFFRLIKKTEATVRFTNEGMVINPGTLGEIKIHPEAYNQIGDYIGIITELKIDQPGIEVRGVIKEYFPNKIWIDINNCEELKDILKKSRGERINSLSEYLTEKGMNADVTQITNMMNSELDKALYTAIPTAPDMPDKAKEEFKDFRNQIAQELRTPPKEGQSKLANLKSKCEEHRKEYFFKSSTDYAKNISYIEKADTVERNLCGGKNLEEWKLEERKTPEHERENIEEHIEKAEKVRQYRLAMDIMVLIENGNDSAIRNTLKAMEWDDDDINDISDELKKNSSFQEVKKSVIEFFRKIKTFSDGNNEGLCYTIHCKLVEKILQNILKKNDLSEVVIRRKRFFSNLRTGGYNKLRRIFYTNKMEAIELFNAAKKVMSITKLIPDIKIERLGHCISTIGIINYKKGVAKSKGNKDLLKELMEGEDECEKLAEDIKGEYNVVKQITSHGQWTHTFAMLDHCLRHADDFTSSSNNRTFEKKAQSYFGTYSERIFKDENIISDTCAQDGNIRIINYFVTVGLLTHVGFAFEAYNKYTKWKKITSHFMKQNGPVLRA